MFERFTDRARRVVVLAQEEARMLNHNYIGTEHILLALIHEGEGVAAKVLASLGIALVGARQQVVEIVGLGQQAPSGHIPFTPQAKKVMQLSNAESRHLGHSHTGTEHILLGLIREDDDKSSGEDKGLQVLSNFGVEPLRVRQRVLDVLSGLLPKEPDGRMPSSSLVLDQFGRNLTQFAREGKLDPVIGREKEIERVMQVLSRRTKNNPVLIGEPGVGKTAVVEGLAQGIVKGEVPETLKNRQLYTLDLGLLVAGSRHHGDVEERLKKVLSEIRRRGDVILFIDDIQAVGPGQARETFAELVWQMHAALVRGEVRAVLVATAAVFRDATTRDPALARVVQQVPLRAPSEAESVDILLAKRDRFEAHHRVTILDEALVVAVDLVAAHVGPQSLPGRAVDLIDEAGARLQISRVGALPPTADLDEQIMQVRRSKEAAIDAQNWEQAAHLRDDEKRLLAQKSEREKQWKSGALDILAEVDEALIREVAADLFADPQITSTLDRPVAPAGVMHPDLFRDETSLWLIC